MFVQHIYFNHSTLMKQSLKTLSLEDLRFPTKCVPKKSALLTEVLKQLLLNILFNQIRSFLSLFFIWAIIKYPQHLPHWIIFENFISRRFQIPKRAPSVMKIICPGQLLLIFFTIEGEWVNTTSNSKSHDYWYTTILLFLRIFLHFWIPATQVRYTSHHNGRFKGPNDWQTAPTLHHSNS